MSEAHDALSDTVSQSAVSSVGVWRMQFTPTHQTPSVFTTHGVLRWLELPTIGRPSPHTHRATLDRFTSTVIPKSIQDSSLFFRGVKPKRPPQRPEGFRILASCLYSFGKTNIHTTPLCCGTGNREKCT